MSRARVRKVRMGLEVNRLPRSRAAMPRGHLFRGTCIRELQAHGLLAFEWMRVPRFPPHRKVGRPMAGRNETTMDNPDGPMMTQSDPAAAAADMTELNKRHEVSEAKRKVDDLLEAAKLLEWHEPKMAATLVGRAHRAMVAWSKMVEPDSPS